VNPLALVLKDGLSYLVCSMWGYQDIRLLVLHRISECQIMDIPASVPESFNLDEYISSGELDFVIGEAVQLKAIFSPGAAFHLSERPISEDQTITNKEDGRILIEETVLDTSELRWWLLAFGDQVEIDEPKHIREEFSAIAAKMLASYS